MKGMAETPAAIPLSRRQFISAGAITALGIATLGLAACQPSTASRPKASRSPVPSPTPTATATPPAVPLAIAAMRARSYPGSALTLTQALPAGSNYRQSIATYLSDGLKINGLLTIPSGAAPTSGWPVIIFNHGFIPPAQYRTTERYVAYVDALARHGYIVFKSDYRGHGSSQGQPSSAYGTPDYTVDVLNALATLQQFPEADPNRIGFWGHSMGGHITLRSLVINQRHPGGGDLGRRRGALPGSPELASAAAGQFATVAQSELAPGLHQPLRHPGTEPGLLGFDFPEYVRERRRGRGPTASRHGRSGCAARLLPDVAQGANRGWQDGPAVHLSRR